MTTEHEKQANMQTPEDDYIGLVATNDEIARMESQLDDLLDRLTVLTTRGITDLAAVHDFRTALLDLDDIIERVEFMVEPIRAKLRPHEKPKDLCQYYPRKAAAAIHTTKELLYQLAETHKVNPSRLVAEVYANTPKGRPSFPWDWLFLADLIEADNKQ